MELLSLGENPISEEKPEGDDVRFEPEFEELESEIQKLSSLTFSGGVDWDKIIKLSQNILSQKSKNLLVATYLSFALMKTRGLSGFADSVHVIRDLLDNFWDSMYPPIKRMRGRINAISWWAERIDTGIGDIKTETWSKEKRDLFVGDFSAIDTFVRDNIEEGPTLRRIIEGITSLVGEESQSEQPPREEVPETPVEETPKQAEPKQETFPPSPPRLSPVQPQEVVTDTDANQLLKQGLNILGKVATLYLKQDNLSSIPFRLNRIVAWLPVQNLPPSTSGKTLIPPPDEQVVSSLQSQYQLNNWRKLLEVSESQVRQYLFWIDLSRYVSDALEQLRYPAISDIVIYETVDYVNRLKGIEKLTFADGTPFADEETREWLKTVTKQRNGGTDMLTITGGNQIEQLVSQELAEAQKMIKENKIIEALNGFREKLNHASSVRERFIWEIGLCRLLLTAKKPRLVVPYIHEILSMLDMYKIESWEPGLAVEGLTLVLSGLRLQEEKKDEKLIENVLDRVSALNPVTALDLL